MSLRSFAVHADHEDPEVAEYIEAQDAQGAAAAFAADWWSTEEPPAQDEILSVITQEVTSGALRAFTVRAEWTLDVYATETETAETCARCKGARWVRCDDEWPSPGEAACPDCNPGHEEGSS